jgi:hypothetical protein
MAMSTTPKNGSPFNAKSAIVVKSNISYESRTNDLVTDTPTSGELNTRLDDSFDEVYFYGNPSGTY